MVNGNKNLVFQETIDILTSQGKFYINLGLERVQKVLDLIDNPEDKLRYIHVVGTNGKGSVCAMLSSMFTAHRSLKVGLFTSPHIFEYTERIKINDTEIDKETFAKEVNEIIELADRNEIHLTEFEILTVVAFDYFAKNNVDLVILETGLGGRFDATNVIKNNICSIITHIDFDHTERLGDTIEKIAFEKAGIIKENCPVIINKNNAGINLIKQIAEEKNSELIYASPLAGEGSFSTRGMSVRKTGEEYTLKGTYQRENLALVLSAIDILNKNEFDILQVDIDEGLKNVKHPCRFEYLKEHNIIIDGAHNPNGTKALRESLDYYYPNQKFKFIFGCLNSKNYIEMMRNLFRQGDEIYFYQFDNPNSCSIAELAKNCEFNSNSYEDYYRNDNTLTVVCGSFYMIKELLKKMGIK